MKGSGRRWVAAFVTVLGLVDGPHDRRTGRGVPRPGPPTARPRRLRPCPLRIPKRGHFHAAVAFLTSGRSRLELSVRGDTKFIVEQAWRPSIRDIARLCGVAERVSASDARQDRDRRRRCGRSENGSPAPREIISATQTADVVSLPKRKCIAIDGAGSPHEAGFSEAIAGMDAELGGYLEALRELVAIRLEGTDSCINRFHRIFPGPHQRAVRPRLPA